MLKELELIEEYLKKINKKEKLDIVIQESLRIEKDCDYFNFVKKQLIKNIENKNCIDLYDDFHLSSTDNDYYIALNKYKQNDIPVQICVNTFVSLVDFFKEGNREKNVLMFIKSLYIKNIDNKIALFCLKYLCVFFVYLLICVFVNFVANKMSSRPETSYIINFTLISTMMLFFLNYLNPYFKIKMPIYLIFIIYALLSCFSSTIKKILGLELFFKLDFDPFIWILSIVVYFFVFYANLWVRAIFYIFFMVIVASMLSCIFLLYICIWMLKKCFRLNKDNFLVFSEKVKELIKYLGYEFYDIESDIVYKINKKIEYTYFNLFNFRDNINIKKKHIKKKFILLLIMMFSLHVYEPFLFTKDKLINSYYALYSSKNNGYCKNFNYDVYIIKDSGKAWLDQHEMTEFEMNEFLNQLAGFPEKRFVGIKCD